MPKKFHKAETHMTQSFCDSFSILHLDWVRNLVTYGYTLLGIVNLHLLQTLYYPTNAHTWNHRVIKTY